MPTSKKLIAAPPLNGTGEPGPGKQGRPSKKHRPEIVAQILDSIRAGAPYNLSCQAAGVSPDSFADWRRGNPDFARQVEQAAAQGALKRLKKIERHGEENFAALSWMLERQFPAHFSRPEVQLNIQNNLAVSQNGSSDFESIVLSDLEYSRLRGHPDYRHHKAEPGVIEVEAERVPEELSGHLSKQGHGGKVISESQQAQRERRVRKSEAFVDALFASKKASGGRNGEVAVQLEHAVGSAGSVRENSPPKSSSPEASSSGAMMPAMITLPTGAPTQAWWQQLVSGSPERAITKEAAVYAIRRALGHAIGENRAGSVPIDFSDGPITVGDVLSGLDAIAGANGQRALIKLAGQSN